MDKDQAVQAMNIAEEALRIHVREEGCSAEIYKLGDALAAAAERADCECRASPCPLAEAASAWRAARNQQEKA